MAGFSSANFLETYGTSDVSLIIKSNVGVRVKGINVCKYLNSGAEGKELWIQLEGEKTLVLDFPSETDAKTAAFTLATAINTLVPNCAIAPTYTGTVPKQVKTAAVYRTEALSSSLTEGSIYEVTDTTNSFGGGIGKVYSGFVTRADQTVVDMYNVTDQKLATLDYDNYIMTNTTDTISQTSELLGSQIIKDATVQYVSADLNSYADLAVNSEYIKLQRSTLTGSTLTNLELWKSTITNADTIDNAIFEGITADLSTWSAGDFSDIKVSAFGDTTGKYNEVSGATADQTYYAYKDPETIIAPSSYTANISYTLDNAFPDAYAEFYVNVPIGVSFGNYVLFIKDSLGTIIDTIHGGYEGKELIYYYDKATGLFKKKPVSSQNVITVSIPVTSDGQVTFTDILPFPPNDPTTTILTVRGHVAKYGVSADYQIVGRTVIWTNNSYELYTTDEVEITII